MTPALTASGCSPRTPTARRNNSRWPTSNRKELQRRIEAWRQQQEDAEELKSPLEWADILRDLEALTETTLETGGKRFIVRSEARAAATQVFRACGLALPPTLRSA